MQNIKGTQLPIFPFNGEMKTIKNIIYYDGPLMTYNQIEKDGLKVSLVFFWVDCDKKYNRWMILLPVKNVLDQFLEGKQSFFNLVNYSVIFMVDMDNDLAYHNILHISYDNIPKEYLPKEDWFLTNKMLEDAELYAED